MMAVLERRFAGAMSLVMTAACGAIAIEPDGSVPAGRDARVAADAVTEDARAGRPDASASADGGGADGAGDAAADGGCPACAEPTTRWLSAGATSGSATITSAAIDERGGVTGGGALTGNLGWGPHELSETSATTFFVRVSDSGAASAPVADWLRAVSSGRAEDSVLGADLNASYVREFDGVQWRARAIAHDGSDQWSLTTVWSETVLSSSPAGILGIARAAPGDDEDLVRWALSDRTRSVWMPRWARSHVGGPWRRLLEMPDGSVTGIAANWFETDPPLELVVGSATIRAERAALVRSAAGDAAWGRAISADLSDLDFDPAGNVYVTGCYDAPLAIAGEALELEGVTDGFVASFDTEGSLRWAARIGGRGTDCARSVAVDRSVVLVAGSFEGRIGLGARTFESAGAKDIFVAAWSVGGEPLWARTGGGPGHDEASVVRTTRRGAAVVGGSFSQRIEIDGAVVASDAETAPFLWRLDLGSASSERCAGVDCAGLDSACVDGTCDEATGFCSPVPAREGASCVSDDLCRSGTVCSGGACGGGAERDCSALDGECVVGRCDPFDGACSAVSAADGSACGLGAGECNVRSCLAGACATGPALDCSPCSGGYCGAGACGASPTALRYAFDGPLPGGWETLGDSPWAIEPGGGIASGLIGNSEASVLRARLTLAHASAVDFAYSVSADASDGLEVSLDGVVDWRARGVTPERRYSLLVPAGAHTVEWRYVKDGSISFGDDRAVLRWVEVHPVALSPESFEGASVPSGLAIGSPTAWTIEASTGARSGARALVGRAHGYPWRGTSYTFTADEPSELQFWLRTEGLFVHPEYSDVYAAVSLYLDGSATCACPSLGWVDDGWSFHRVPVASGTHTMTWTLESTDGRTGSVVVDDLALVPASRALPLCGL